MAMSYDVTATDTLSGFRSLSMYEARPKAPVAYAHAQRHPTPRPRPKAPVA